MPIPPGRRLGTYEVLAAIDAGGAESSQHRDNSWAGAIIIPASIPIGTNFTLRGINTAVLRANQPEMNTCTKKGGGWAM
jgi:hypothetical protein